MTVWASKQVYLLEWGECQDLMAALVRKHGARDFAMLSSMDTSASSFRLYIGLPRRFLDRFRDFYAINPADIPDGVKALIVSEEFQKRFPEIAKKVRSAV